MGGFARRMSYWKAFAAKYPSRTLLRLDGGSIFSRGTAASPTVNRYMLEGTYRSNLDAICLTEWDVPVWQEMGDMATAGLMAPEYLKVPLVSANLTAKVANFPALQRYVMKELRVDPQAGKSLRVAITGLLVDPEGRIPRKDFQIQKPDEAARQLVGELQGKADYIIVLSDMGLGEAISLAVTVPGINMIVISHNYTQPTEPQQVGDAIVVGPVNEGKMLTEIRFNVKSGAQSMQMESHSVGLDRSVPDDPAMGELVHKAQTEVAKEQK